jgi:hypothetical protein
LGQASPNAANTMDNNKIYVVRKQYDYDEWELIDIVIGKNEAEKLLKKPSNFDTDASAPHIDQEHMFEIKTSTTNPDELKLIVEALKKMPNIYANDWQHY